LQKRTRSQREIQAWFKEEILMIGTKNLIAHVQYPRSWKVLLLVGVFILQPAFATVAQQGYESSPFLGASKVLPPELLAGPNHRVEEKVVNDGYLNTYRIGSKFGTFTALSTAMLRKRISEINALVLMEKIQGTKEFTASLKEAGTDTLVGFKNLVTSPVQTVTGAVSGLGVALRRAGDNLTGPKRSESEDSRVKDFIGFSKTKREYAHQLGVDVYSDNEKLQERLNEIAWAGYGGGLTWAAAMAAVPGGAGLAITVSGSHRLLNEVFRTTPPADLRRMNAEKLKAMDVHPEIADTFISNALFSPRQQTLLVNALEEMKGVANRGVFVRFAGATQNPNLVFFRQRQAEMYAGYHRTVAPLEGFLSLEGLPAGRTTGGNLVFNAPLDHLVWTEPIARFITAVNSVVQETGGIKGKEFWVTGTLSARAKKEIESRGWQVQERSEERLLDWVESYPKYEKPEERIPSGLVSLTFKSVAVGIGGSSGDGILSYRGRDYPFSISGVSLVDVGVSTFQGAGKVYDLKSLNDFAGNYVAAQAGLAVRGGTGELSMRNTRGVSIVLLSTGGKESGTRLNLGPGGVTIKMK
jgi:hypothetical protein